MKSLLLYIVGEDVKSFFASNLQTRSYPAKGSS